MPECMTKLVPGYIETSRLDAWGRVLVQLDHDDIVIVNPSSGPGTTVDPGWQRVIADVHRAGALAFGYVPVRRGDLALSSIYDVHAWSQMYEVDGIFDDEFPADELECPLRSPKHRSLEAQILVARRATDPRENSNEAKRVIFNPGRATANGYVLSFPRARCVVTHEGDGDTVPAPQGSFERPQACLLWNCPDPAAAMVRMEALGWDYGWATSDAGRLGNPWNENPAD